MKRLISLIIAIILSLPFFAQNELDALRYSMWQYYSSARSMGMANAMGALGGDVGAVMINPAAVAFFNRGLLSFSPGFVIGHSVSDFNGQVNSANKYNFTLNEFSLIFNNLNENSTIRNFAFGITYNRIADFNNKLLIQGINEKGSMLDYFVDMANGLPPSSLDEYSTFLAYDTYLIDILDSTNLSYTNPLWITGGPYYGETQRKISNSTGRGTMLDIVIGFNVLDKIYVGLAISSLSMHYSQTSTFSEFDYNPAVELESFNYNETLQDYVSGWGVKAGINFRPVSFVRLAAAAFTPYLLKVRTKYYSSIDSHWRTPDSEGYYDYFSGSPVQDWIYKISAPWHYILSGGIVIGKILALDVDYEVIDYTAIEMEADNYTFFYENQNIKQYFKKTENFRLGGELNISGFQLRAGAAYYPSPYQDLSDKIIIAAGLGIRSKSFFFDIAYNQATYTQNYLLYIPYVDEPMPTVKWQKSMLSMTMGIRF